MKKWFKRQKAEARSFEEIVAQKEESAEVSENEGGEEKCESAKEVPTERVFEEIRCNALDCFGMREGKTDKRLIKCANIWYLVISFIWFLTGCLTFAPIIFLQSKVNVIFGDKKKSLLCALLIYFAIVILFTMIIFF